MAQYQRAFTLTAFQKPHQNGFGFLPRDCTSVDGVFLHDRADFIPRIHINDGWMAAFVDLILMFDLADIDGVLQNLIKAAFIQCLATDNVSVFGCTLLLNTPMRGSIFTISVGDLVIKNRSNILRMLSASSGSITSSQAAFDVVHQAFQSRTIHIAACKAAIIIFIRKLKPAFMLL